MQMFNYAEFPASDKLSDFVECFWILKMALDHDRIIQEVLVPGGRAEIIFSNSQMLWYGENKNSEPDRFSGAVLLGQRKAANYLGFSGSIHFLGVRFKIGCLPLFTKTQAHRYSNKITPLTAIMDTTGIPGVDELLLMSEDTAISCVERWLQQNFISPSPDWSILNNFIAQFTFDSDYKLIINNLSEQNGWNSKKTERLFLKYTGFAPRTFMKLLRFRNLMDLMKEKPGSFTKAALDLGFYDQSHFIREFQNYTGYNPSSFYNSPPEIATMLYKLSK